MPDETAAAALQRLIGGHPAAAAEVVEAAAVSTSVPVLVAAALLARKPELVTRAAEHATTTRDRQLVELAAADLRGDTQLLDALVRDHLSEYPEHLLASWIAGHRHLDHHQ